VRTRRCWRPSSNAASAGSSSRGDMRVQVASLRSLPEGEGENSPGWSPPWRMEPWEGAAPSRRDGRTSPPNISRIIFNAVLFEKGDILGLKIALPVMLFLARDIRQRCAHLSPSDGERTVPFLPFKVIDCAGFMHPARGCALDFPYRRGDRRGRGQREQNMNVVLHAADAKRLHLVFTRDAAHVGPQPWLDFREDDLVPLLGGEDTVKERAAIGV